MSIDLYVNSAAAFGAEETHDWRWTNARWRLLAEGDSWFSVGSLNLFQSANLLEEMAFSQFAAAVQCAYPGDTLRRMVKMSTDPNFVQLLCGNRAWRWNAIVLSAGGNDLIDAAGLPPENETRHRLLLTPPEWGPPSQGAPRYLSPEGWQTFATYFQANLDTMIAMRDSGPSTGRPLCMHTYAYPTPRPSGAGLGQGPWLMPSLQRFAIPEDDWPAVARALLDRLGDLMLQCAADTTRYPQLHVFDSRTLDVTAAEPGSEGRSGDWLNEIHLTREGCRKLALAWCTAIEAVLLANP